VKILSTVHRIMATPMLWDAAHRMGRLWKFKKEEDDEWVKAGGGADKIKLDEQEERK